MKSLQTALQSASSLKEKKTHSMPDEISINITIITITSQQKLTLESRNLVNSHFKIEKVCNRNPSHSEKKLLYQF